MAGQSGRPPSGGGPAPRSNRGSANSTACSRRDGLRWRRAGDFLLTAEDEGAVRLRALGLNSSTSSLSWPTPRQPRWKSTVPRRILSALPVSTPAVHLAQGIPAGVDGHVVEVQHVIAVPEVDGIEIVLALVVVQQGAGTEATTQPPSSMRTCSTRAGGALLNGNGVSAAGGAVSCTCTNTTCAPSAARMRVRLAETPFSASPRTTCTTVRLLPSAASMVR